MNKEELRQYSAKLLGEKEELQQRIDKAIKYCESYCCWESEDGVFYESDFCIDDLEEILKGEDKE